LVRCGIFASTFVPSEVTASYVSSKLRRFGKFVREVISASPKFVM
jgi:hypothetical protein